MIKKDYNWAAFKKVGVIPSKNNHQALAGVEDVFTKYLMRAGYTVVERNRIEYLLAEQKMTLDGAFAAGPDGRSPGEILGVDALLIVQVMAYDAKKKNMALFNQSDKIEEPVYKNVKEKKPDGKIGDVLRQVGTKVTYRNKASQQILGYSAQVSVTARLVNAWTGEVLWTASREGNGSSTLYAVEDSAGYLSRLLASDIRKALKP